VRGDDLYIRFARYKSIKTMAKKLEKKVKLQIEAGKANPAPPLGPALGQAGINIGDFVQKFNAESQDMIGNKVSVVISVYDDRSYDFIIKTPPASGLILKAAGIAKGSGKNVISKVGKITKAQALDIAKQKEADLNFKDDEGAINIIAGTARSMGIDVKD
jgi:large subunit ribosomal protein L11